MMRSIVTFVFFAAGVLSLDAAGDVLQRSGVTGGLVVVVGCQDVDLLVDLGSRDGCVVQGLDTDAMRIADARAAMRAERVTGRVSAVLFDGRRLPYIDNLVNLLVAEDEPDAILFSEIQRVLAPGGVALLGNRKIVKEIPRELGEWTHHMYDATGIGAGRDTAVSQPRSMQWKAGPEYSRSHENMSSVSAVVSAGGRVFAIMDEGPKASIYLPSQWFLSARDAFSGVLLWKKPIAQWHAQLFPLKSGPAQLPRRLVAVGDRVYVTLGIDAPVSELDAATGKTLRTFAGTEHAEELLYVDGKLLVVTNEDSAVEPYRGRIPGSRPEFVLDEQTIRTAGSRCVAMIDTQTGESVWKTPPTAIVSQTVASDGERVFLLRGDQISSLEMESGEYLWSEKVANKAVRFGTASSPTLLVYHDVVYLANQGTLSARDAETGREMWSAPCAAAGYKAPASIFVVNDLVWDVDAGGEPYRPGSDPNRINRYYTGYALRTGEVVKKIPVSGEHGYAIMHHRCHVPRASGNSIITSFPGIEFFNVETGESTHDSWLRGACLYGFLPANGLIYTPPHPCACYTQGKLTGFWAVAGRRDRQPTATTADRLAKGPAYGTLEAKLASSTDWPTYRADAARSGTTSVAIPLSVSRQWTADVDLTPSQCVVADGKLFVATGEDHTVRALEAESGRALWQFTAGGRVDSSPTYHQGRVLFGSRDGYVYCLGAEDGQLAWRFRAAPWDRRCVAYDQVESVWPVHGSVLVQDGVAWFCAGRSSFLDGGLTVYRLDACTGQQLSATPIDTLDDKDEQPPITSTIFARLDMQGAKNDILSCDGDHVFMRHWTLDLKGSSVAQDEDHLFSPTGFLDASWFRRTYWIYGRMYVSGAQGWARTGNARPSGRILSIDEDRLYGFGRDYYPPSPGNQHQMYLAGEQERLFAMVKPAEVTVLDAEQTAPRKKPAKGQDVLWSVPADLQIRCMVLAGQDDQQRLLVAGAKGDWITSQAAYEGRLGSVLRVISVADGTVLAERDLPGLPVFDGMSVAAGRLFVSLVDGQIVCFGPDES